MADSAEKGFSGTPINFYSICFYSNIPFMSKIDNGGKKTGENQWEEKKLISEIVATTSLPVDRLMATNCNVAAHVNLDDFNTHFVSCPPSNSLHCQKL